MESKPGDVVSCNTDPWNPDTVALCIELNSVILKTVEQVLAHSGTLHGKHMPRRFLRRSQLLKDEDSANPAFRAQQKHPMCDPSQQRVALPKYDCMTGEVMSSVKCLSRFY